MQCEDYKSESVVEHHGRVIRLEGERVWVRISQTSACAGCHVASACGAADKEDKIIEAIAGKESLTIGMPVLVRTNKGTAYSAVVWSYVVPTLVVIGVMALLTEKGISDALAGIVSLGALLPYYGFLYIIRNKLKKRFLFSVVAEGK